MPNVDSEVVVKFGELSSYKGITPDPDTVYVITDVPRVYVGDILCGAGQVEHTAVYSDDATSPTYSADVSWTRIGNLVTVAFTRPTTGTIPDQVYVYTSGDQLPTCRDKDTKVDSKLVYESATSQNLKAYLLSSEDPNGGVISIYMDGGTGQASMVVMFTYFAEE